MPNKEKIALRLPKCDRDLLDRLCEARSETISNFVRRAIRAELARLGFYPENVRRALGLENVVVVSTGKKREGGLPPSEGGEGRSESPATEGSTGGKLR